MLSFKVFGLRRAQTRMAARGRRLRNRRGANLKAAVLVEQWTLRNMQAEGRRHESGTLYWPPLKASTRRQRARIGKWPGKMLQVTGRLRNAFEVSANNRHGRVRNRVGYAAYHEEGTSRMPRRKLFPTERQGRRIALPAYQDHVRKALRG